MELAYEEQTLGRCSALFADLGLSLIPQTLVEGRKRSSGFTLTPYEWGVQFSSVSVKLSVFNLSLCPTCETEVMLYRQQGIPVTAVAKVWQICSLDPPPEHKQHREARTEAAHSHYPLSCAPDFSSNICCCSSSALSALFLHSPEDMCRWEGLGRSMVVSGQSCCGRQPMRAHRLSEQSHALAMFLQLDILLSCNSSVITQTNDSSCLGPSEVPLAFLFTDAYSPCLKNPQRVHVKCVGVQFPAGASMKLSVTEN